MRFSDIKEAVKGNGILNHNDDAHIETLLIDSRKISDAAQGLFIAIKTPQRDGHDFIAQAYEKGVRHFLISTAVAYEQFPEASFIIVPNTVSALHQLTIHIRNQYHFPVIAITGSNGKTIVKEWLYQLLATDYHIVRSPKSYNSQIGIPLSVWHMNKNNNLAIFEAGISQPDEMIHSEKMLQPTIGIFTNIGEAHSEGFLNMRQKINEKLILFKHTKQLIYCKDHHELNECIVQYSNQVRNTPDNTISLFTWSTKTEATLRISSIEKNAQQSIISGIYKGNNVTITIPFTDNASVENAIHCWCTLLLLNVSTDVITKRMLELHAVAMRLQVVKGINNCTIINDTYNSDLTSLQIALDFLEQQKQHQRKTVILSDILQLGISDNELYEKVAQLIHQKNIHRIICIGNALQKNKASFRKYNKLRSVFFTSTEAFIQKLHHITFDNEAILLKGARTFKFEKIEKLLEQKLHKTALEVNLTAIENNIKVYKSLIPAGVKTMGMVKAYSYGSGSYEIANLLQFSGIDYLTVAYVDEGVALRKGGITAPIMVMSPEASTFERMISWKLEPEIFSLYSLQKFNEAAKSLGVQQYPIHIKLDTGMHRLGFSPEEIPDLISTLRSLDTCKVASIFSHLAGSDEEQFDDYSQQQAHAFNGMTQLLVAALEYKPLLHILNSSGIVRLPHLCYDMVRIGIGMYGYDSAQKIQAQLHHIATLKTTIAQIKHLKAGDTVGYSRKAVLNRDSVIATVSIGYADGYFRDFGNGTAYMLINGKPATVIGSVCMDMCMLDITDIPEAAVGNEVIVFGRELPISQLAKWAKTIPYEILTSISQRVNRIYINE
jgi:alanine racemase